MTTVKLVATEKGYYNDEIIREGQTFTWEMPEWALKDKIPMKDVLPVWAEPVAGYVAPVEFIEDDMTEDDRETKIIDAVNCLDKDNDDHWTSEGDPMLKAIQDITDFRVSRAEVKALCPGVER